MKNYILNFTKIDPDNLVAGVGTAGNIWIVLNALLAMQQPGTLFVDMEKELTINTEDHLIDGTKNAWEYYFNQKKRPENDVEFLDSVNIVSRITYERRYKHLDPICKKLKDLFWANFSLKDYLSDEIESFERDNFSNKITLGIQIRLTDMSNYFKVKNLNSYILKTNKILKKYPQTEQIFLATDDQKIISEFSSKVKRPVVCQKGIYRATENKPDLDPYDRYYSARENHRFLLGKEVIVDLFLLSRCNMILKADISCVSQLAIFFSGNISKTFFITGTFEFLMKKLKSSGKSFFKRIKNIFIYRSR